MLNAGPRSKGLKLAVAMLAFMLLELGLIADAWMSGRSINRYVVYLLGAKVVLFLVQLIGVVLVTRNRFRLGGALQIFASALHVPELVGVVGIAGGLAAYRYSEIPRHPDRT
jgi:hypothetical protein